MNNPLKSRARDLLKREAIDYDTSYYLKNAKYGGEWINYGDGLLIPKTQIPEHPDYDYELFRAGMAPSQMSRYPYENVNKKIKVTYDYTK